MKKNPPHRRPGNSAKGYDRKEFKKYSNRHLMSYPKRIKKLHVTHGKKNYFPVSIMFFLEGYELPEFITSVQEIPNGSSNPDYYILEKSNLSHDTTNNKWILEMGADESRNPNDEYMVQFDVLLDADDWGDCEILGVLINGLELKKKKNKADLLTVECDIIIPPPTL